MRIPVTRERIIATAAELVDSRGPDALVLSQLAETLDVRQSALYKHVDGVDDVQHRLSLLARHMLAEHLRAAAVGLAKDDAVFALADAWRGFVRTHPGLYAITDRYPTAPHADLVAAVGEVVDVINRVIAGYGLSDDDSEQAAWSLRSALHGFCVLEAQEGHPAGADPDRTYRRLVELLCAGIARM
ncbi:TetR/AcrR family transcriptional regulator [Rhodococcus sp. IEGM 1379]|uniref:TetR/AcrR family transcriptional regulator n=1 Tax=Rhodococcus sp. IEGM 1379 TaxID=3047086 RepID=UPI0024B8383C|nr:TetR/AcrR family transcriptional regulator [Rhodococcus sp. IEGM 1379]MDI9917158.1 WHG domain-containing protein [Rhodococcus sp. IEGM 1379]